MAARYWRVVGLSAHAEGDLVLTELHLRNLGARVAAAATVSASHAAASGTIDALSDGVASTDVAWAVADLGDAAFAITWDCGTAVDVDGVVVGTSTDRGTSLHRFALEYSADNVTWTRHQWSGLTDEIEGVDYPAPRSILPIEIPAYRYWRLVGSRWRDAVAGTGNSGLMRLAEWELFEGTTEYPHVAMTGAAAPSPYAATSSGDLAGHNAWHAFNGVVADTEAARWISDEESTRDKWLQIDLGTARRITSIKLAPDGSVSSGYYLIEFYVLASNTGAFVGEEKRFTLVSGLAQSAWSNLTRKTFLGPRVGWLTNTSVPPPNTSASRSLVAASTPIPALSVILGGRSLIGRDAEFGGPYAITGTVKIKGETSNAPVRRRVRLVRDLDGMLVRETWSRASDGVFAFTGLTDDYAYTVYTQDHTGSYRAVIADRLTAELPA